MAEIQFLIDKQDNFEIIRDQIAFILKTEITNQIALATTAGEPDPDLWKVRVFTEAYNPFAQFLKSPVIDTSPLVNIWFDTTSMNDNASNNINQQQFSGVFNLDVYGYGVSQDNALGGHKSGDVESALASQRALRLVRNIIMASQYTYLQLRGVVGRRWISNISMFQPQQNEQNVQQVIGARIALNVSYIENTAQFEGEELNYISVDVKRQETGEIYLTADYNKE